MISIRNLLRSFITKAYSFKAFPKSSLMPFTRVRDRITHYNKKNNSTTTTLNCSKLILFPGGPQPATLQEVTIPIWSNAECRLKYGAAAPGGIVEHMLCAGKANMDSCSVSTVGIDDTYSRQIWTNVKCTCHELWSNIKYWCIKIWIRNGGRSPTYILNIYIFKKKTNTTCEFQLEDL